MKVTIASGKGGTGKTTLATNLAAFLSESMHIALIDLDVEEPNSGLFVHGDLKKEEVRNKKIPEWIKERCTLCGLCQSVCNYHAIIQLGEEIMVFPELCHSCHACSELCPENALPMEDRRMGTLKHFTDGNLTFIESSLDIGQEQAVPLIAQTLEYADHHAGKEKILILDAPPGTSCPVIEATKGADYIILVTEPTPFGLHDMKLAVEVMLKLNKEFGVVINREGIGNDDVEKFCMREDITILAKIPNDRRIAELYSQGMLIFNKIKEFKNALKRISSHIIHLSELGKK